MKAQLVYSIIFLLLMTSLSSSAKSINAERGKALWQKNYRGEAPFTNRSCTSCHGDNLSVAGKHIKTNKVIAPMACSVNVKRLSNDKKVAKWFLRNCKWTMGRECSDEEKQDISAYLKTL